MAKVPALRRASAEDAGIYFFYAIFLHYSTLIFDLGRPAVKKWAEKERDENVDKNWMTEKPGAKRFKFY